ncbi:MAG: DUF3656 domain-containing protein [Porcipelethomonas sp.]
MNRTEILAPAGSPESLSAAVNCGADAVYIGGKNFSARQNAANFDTMQLKEAAGLCHLYGVKLYVTVNTLILDHQADEFAEFVKEAAEAGADAFIVQDPGAAEIIRNTIPEACIHGSTQMSVHTVNGALFLREKGFKRVVLSRELSKEQIREISGLGIETEIFVHGALCMSVSGQCYMSSVIGQRSANRGLCAQPCRLPFSACRNRDFAGLSLKDLSYIGHLRELSQLGVTSFKIEGRMKRPEYVASAVSACVQSLHGEKPDMSLLRAVFSRSGFTDGYLTGKRENMFGSREKEDVIAAAKILPEVRKTYMHTRKTGTIDFKAVIRENSPAVLCAESGGREVTVSGDIPQKAINKPLSEEYLKRQLSKLGGTPFEPGSMTAEIDEGITLSASSVNALRREACERLTVEIISANTRKYRFRSLDIPLEDKRENLSAVRARIADVSQLDAAAEADMIIMPADVFLKSSISGSPDIIIEPPRFIADEIKVRETLLQCRRRGAERLMCCNIAYLKTGRELGFKLHGDFGLNISNSYSLDFFRKNGLEDAVLSFEMTLSQIG